jgi:hypothetical protein
MITESGSTVTVDRPLRLITRTGHCIEGLSIAYAIALVRVLG